MMFICAIELGKHHTNSFGPSLGGTVDEMEEVYQSLLDSTEQSSVLPVKASAEDATTFTNNLWDKFTGISVEPQEKAFGP